MIARRESQYYVPESTLWAGLLVGQLLYDLHQLLHKMPRNVFAGRILQPANDALRANGDLGGKDVTLQRLRFGLNHLRRPENRGNLLLPFTFLGLAIALALFSATRSVSDKNWSSF